ncbi:MAG: polysaccharide biosynthesis/export family protein [Sphingobium sp.]
MKLFRTVFKTVRSASAAIVMLVLATAINAPLAAQTVPAGQPLAQPQPMGQPLPAANEQAAATVQPATEPATAPITDGAYVLGPGDVVNVSVLGRPEFNPQVQVQTDGTLQLPFLGTVKAADMTVLQFRDKVGRMLEAGGYYADPVVNVAIANYASRYVIVLGEVGQPGMVPIDRDYRVSEILARVGGARDTGSDFLTLRRASGEELKLDTRMIAIGGPNEDPVVKPGDKLFIPKAETFYVYGQVNSPGTYKIESGMTLRKAIATAGGVGAMGSEKKAKIYRDGEKIKRFDLSGLIKDGDVIVIGERFF